ncbi:hypothetical protein NFI96_008728 [Prochilodus magdalenae]|nr:hypothetical protein NFI96_008728 [Prochilodus magdalenae]
MAPKRQVPTQEPHDGRDSDKQENLPSTSDEAACSTAGSVDKVCEMLRTFICEQRSKDELWRREAEKQEQRWRSMQHQFSLLQEQVRGTRREGRPTRGTEDDYSEGETERLHQTRILRHTPAHDRAARLAVQTPTAPSWPTPRLPTLKDADDVENFLVMFERLAQAAMWPEQMWAIHLVPLLEGKARAAYVAMDAEEALDYGKLKTAILRKFEINKETYRQKFRSDEVYSDETPRELCVRLKGLYEKWITPKEKTKEQIGDTIILEQYLKMVDHELRSWILERNPATMDQAVDLAEAYAMARRAEGSFQLGNSGRQRRQHRETGSDWDTWLPYVLFAYREVPQASIGFSPFQMLYGREVRGPLDVLKEAWEGQKDAQKINILSHILKMREKMTDLMKLAHENLEQAQKRQKSWYDKSAKNRTLKPGDKALVLLPTSDTSLLAKWHGPYEVLRQVNQTTYELLRTDCKKTKQTFHINMLRQWKERDQSTAEHLMVRAVGEEEESMEQYFPSNSEHHDELLTLDHLTTEQREELRTIIPDGLFSEVPGRTTVIQHDIRLQSHDPIRQVNCRVPARLIPKFKEEVSKMLDMGIIEPSTSQWCSPVVLVPKKDGELRFCVDFSKLNSVSAFDPYPMPRADELIERLGKAKFLSTVDLCKGYWQVPLTESARELTAFRAPNGLFHFLTMPFGLHGAAATFQRMMDAVLKGTEDFAASYLDDVVIYSGSWQEHLRHLEAVLGKIRAAGLTANPGKCHLAKGMVSYLGYVLGGGAIRPQVDKVQAVQECPIPTTKRRVRSFLGLVGWYRRFIPNFADRAAPLTNLTKKDQPQRVKWTEECNSAFNDLKDCLCSDPVLGSPDFGKPFVVQTDASGNGLGAVLLQGVENSRRPILYISRKLFPREKNYSTVEKEALAVKWALDSLKYYLMGSDFVLETDHRALKWMRHMKDTNARITRWYLSLQPFRFQRIGKRGTAGRPAYLILIGRIHRWGERSNANQSALSKSNANQSALICSNANQSALSNSNAKQPVRSSSNAKQPVLSSSNANQSALSNANSKVRI